MLTFETTFHGNISTIANSEVNSTFIHFIQMRPLSIA